MQRSVSGSGHLCKTHKQASGAAVFRVASTSGSANMGGGTSESECACWCLCQEEVQAGFWARGLRGQGWMAPLGKAKRSRAPSSEGEKKETAAQLQHLPPVPPPPTPELGEDPGILAPTPLL